MISAHEISAMIRSGAIINQQKSYSKAFKCNMYPKLDLNKTFVCKSGRIHVKAINAGVTSMGSLRDPVSHRAGRAGFHGPLILFCKKPFHIDNKS